ncbi:hypothetical protein AMST5_03010 [freshwater sediment metagenome]|uniref:Uncharacterized protein n=1 Tax=freshwater sediment metagenome TaxID=556182 RepID=A0AA48M3V2_9ZZZZ
MNRADIGATFTKEEVIKLMLLIQRPVAQRGDRDGVAQGDRVGGLGGLRNNAGEDEKRPRARCPAL